MKNNSRPMASIFYPNRFLPNFTTAPLAGGKAAGLDDRVGSLSRGIGRGCGAGGPRSRSLAAEFGIHVFNAAARVRIPLRREEVSLEPGQAKLDDLPYSPNGNRMARLCLEIAEPGEYRLELALRPIVQPGSRPAAFDLAIPRVPTARLEFAVPTGGPKVEFPSAFGAVRWDKVQSRWTAELGPSDRLAAAWQDSAPADTASAVDVEQLLWLKIEQGCVLVDVGMKAKANGGQLRRLFVRADSALELLPSGGAGFAHCRRFAAAAIRGRLTKSNGPSRSVRWRLRPAFPVERRVERGHVRVPQIEVVDARPVAERWPSPSILH